MRKFILLVNFLSSHLNQNFCETGYAKIINNVGNKLLGTTCLVASGVFLGAAYFRYRYAWEEHKRHLLINNNPELISNHTIRHNKRVRNNRNHYLKNGTVYLALAGLFGYSTYYWFKKIISF